jgi:hypothetical protein
MQLPTHFLFKDMRGQHIFSVRSSIQPAADTQGKRLEDEDEGEDGSGEQTAEESLNVDWSEVWLIPAMRARTRRIMKCFGFTMIGRQPLWNKQL